MPLCSSSGLEERHMVLSEIDDFVSHVDFLAADNGLDVLCLARSGLQTVLH